MKNYLIFLIIIILLVILNASCKEDGPDIPNGNFQTRLFKKYYFMNIQDTFYYRCDYYAYDEKDRLMKIFPYIENPSDTSENRGYNLFLYDSENRLRKMITYFWNGIDPDLVVYDSNSYSYEGAHLVKEMLYRYDFGLVNVVTYHYNNNQLVSKKLTNGLSNTWFFYTYQDSLCIREIQSSDSLGSFVQYYTTYIYRNGLKMRSELYGGDKNTLGAITNFYYNTDNKLVFEELLANPDWASQSSQSYRYVYEKVHK